MSSVLCVVLCQMKNKLNYHSKLKFLLKKFLSFTFMPFFVPKDKIIKIHNDEFHIHTSLINNTVYSGNGNICRLFFVNNINIA